MGDKIKDNLNRLDKFVGERIKAIRLEHGLSQAGYGAALGRSLQTINRIERGKGRLTRR